jgi:hypothetical protein
MKTLAFPLLAALVLAGCAQSTVRKTYVATTAPLPRSIYIQPFDASGTEFTGWMHPSTGERPIRKAIAPLEFAEALRFELAKLAPTSVLQPGERAPEGWVVSGSFDKVDAGDPLARMLPLGAIGAGRSTFVAHVKITDAKSGAILHAFDVSGGSGATGKLGSTGAPGSGNALYHDMKNAAERVMLAISQDPMRYGHRSAP